MELMGSSQKKNIETIAGKNRIIDNIIEALVTRDHFLLLGHKNPDEDCIASLVGLAIILSKFSKGTTIYLGATIARQYQYLLNICKYNSITVTNGFSPKTDPVEVIAILDTPKPSMIDASPEILSLFDDPKVVKIEIDHHIGSDGAYCGDEAYSLVTDASSAAELVGHLALKLHNKRKLLADHQIDELFSRNLVLSLLTGIIGDSNMGQFLKSNREKRYYKIFSNMFNLMLTKETTKETNFANMNDIHRELTTLSGQEESCYRYMIGRRRAFPSIGYVVLTKEDMRKLYKRYDNDMVVAVSRTVVDALAEESGGLGLVAYYDNPKESDLVQFRMRRSRLFKDLDLRVVLSRLAIENGGGHEGAIGFRFPSSQVADIRRYVRELLPKVQEMLAATREAHRVP